MLERAPSLGSYSDHPDLNERLGTKISAYLSHHLVLSVVPGL